MTTKPRTRTNRILIGAAAMVGVVAGAAGIASAVTGEGGDGPTSTVATEQRDDDRGDDDRGEDDRGEDVGERDDDLTAEEAAALATAATVTEAEAEASALAEAPGTVRRTEIEEEDGATVWDVEVDGADGSRHDVQVDATSGDIVEHDVDDD